MLLLTDIINNNWWDYNLFWQQEPYTVFYYTTVEDGTWKSLVATIFCLKVFFSPLVFCQIKLFGANFFNSSHLAIMAIGSVTPARLSITCWKCPGEKNNQILLTRFVGYLCRTDITKAGNNLHDLKIQPGVWTLLLGFVSTVFCGVHFKKFWSWSRCCFALLVNNSIVFHFYYYYHYYYHLVVVFVVIFWHHCCTHFANKISS